MSLRSWLFGIAHNVSLNILRQRGSDHEPLENHPGTGEAADATLERRERLREVLAAVAAPWSSSGSWSPPRWRRTFSETLWAIPNSQLRRDIGVVSEWSAR